MLLLAIFLLLQRLEVGDKEELLEDQVDKVLLLDYLVRHLFIRSLDDFPRESDQTDEQSVLVYSDHGLGRLINCLVVHLLVCLGLGGSRWFLSVDDLVYDLGEECSWLVRGCHRIIA